MSIPKHYTNIREKYESYGNALEDLGKACKEGPIDEKTIQLIQLGASVAIRSEGAVHSHVRRALEARASEEEIYHAIRGVTSTIGFPAVAAAISWAEDVIQDK